MSETFHGKAIYKCLVQNLLKLDLDLWKRSKNRAMVWCIQRKADWTSGSGECEVKVLWTRQSGLSLRFGVRRQHVSLQSSIGIPGAPRDLC